MRLFRPARDEEYPTTHRYNEMNDDTTSVGSEYERGRSSSRRERGASRFLRSSSQRRHYERRRESSKNASPSPSSRSSPRRNSHTGGSTVASEWDRSKQTTTPNDDDEVYIVRQRYGVCSIFFSIIQVTVLALMMWQCGVAPLRLNPMVGPYPDALSEWGGKNAVLILDDGETMRLVTPIFLHAGVIHLLGNVAVQLETGAFFEQEWGSVRWLIIYLVSAVGSSVLSVICMPNAVSVGSSGAVMGLFGAKLSEVVLRACDRLVTPQDQVAATVRREQCCVVTLSVLIVMAFSFIPFVDWAAHVGGLAAGMVVGCAIFSLDIPGCVWKVVWLVLGSVATAVYFITTVTYMYSGQVETIDELRDVCGYYKENFEDYECNCMRDEYLQNYNGNGDGGG